MINLFAYSKYISCTKCIIYPNFSQFLSVQNVWIMKKIYIQPVSEQEVLTPLLLQEFTGSSDDVDVGGSDDSDDDNRIKALEDETEWGTLW